jgi:formamidopyrimidine-DNA glycosylase
MPEGPEVKSITDQLTLIEGYRIVNFELYRDFRGKYLRMEEAVGKLVTNVFCFGKKIAFQLNEGYIITSLIMTGKWLHHNKGNPILGLLFEKKTATEKITLFFHDDRRLGDVSYYSDDDFMKIFYSIGPDFLNDKISREDFYLILMKSKNMMLCNFLLDQSKIAGIGNYLRCDIMYHAVIDPFSKIKDLSDEDIDRLYDSCIYIINESYQKGGYSIGDGKGNYMLPSGKRGEYKPLVYKRTEDDCGIKVEKYKRKGGQTIYYVPVTPW